MHLLGLTFNQLNHSVRDAAEGNSIRNAVCQRHHQQGKEGGNGNLYILPFNLFNGTGHHHTHHNENWSGGGAGNKPQQRHGKDRQHKAGRSGQAGKTGSSSFGDSGAGFHISGDGGGTQHSAGGGGNGVRQQRPVCIGQVAFFIQESALAGRAHQGANGIEHVHHGQGEQYGNNGEDEHAHALAGAEQLAESGEALAEGGAQIQVEIESHVRGHADVKAHGVLHHSADRGGPQDADKQSAFDLPHHQSNGENEADHRQNDMGIVKFVQRHKGALAGSDDPGVFQADKGDK